MEGRQMTNIDVKKLALALDDILPCYEKSDNGTTVIEGRVYLEDIAQQIKSYIEKGETKWLNHDIKK